jgi:hypothetical protein
MTSALYVRETLDLSDASEQRLLVFARSRGLRAGDTLVIAAREMTAGPGYIFDLRDPADPTYLLHLAVVADVIDAPGLTIDVAGSTAPGSVAGPGTAGRSAHVICREIRQPLTVRADGGVGASGLAGRDGADETFTIEFDDNGKPYRDYEPPVPGGPGGDGAAGGPGGTAWVLWSAGIPPQVSAFGGAGGAAGKGGMGGRALALRREASARALRLARTAGPGQLDSLAWPTCRSFHPASSGPGRAGNEERT